ncbi:aspartate-semialdehyde dehydrogenase [Vibrio sp. WXL210]|uniref:aspartate-semialdehyde dehydrogenase n=1 Tax=Vibrio sp. WXL210 TaxID=3450709 RepID=UPI003EC4B703
MLDKINQDILDNAIKDDFAGYDPFDGLNSTYLESHPSLRRSLFGLIWTQFHKRSMVNFRPLLGVPKKRNPKGIGLFILGLLENYHTSGDKAYLSQATDLGDWLLEQRCDQTIWQHSCWGYHFDWNARAFYVPKGKPNVITTIYVAQALYQLGKVTDNLKYVRPALDAAQFIAQSLVVEAGDDSYVAYIPGETAFVHNANLWGAAWMAKAGGITHDYALVESALRCARSSARAQQDDGSWVYGSRSHHQFIDGFHTGYNLEALHLIKQSLNISEFDVVIKKGLNFYRRALFEQDGTAKYYNQSRYPLDMHSVAQAILTFVKVGGTPQDILWAEKVCQRSIDTLYKKRNRRFVYQKHALLTNSVDYLRWTQAWVYYSFSYLSRIKSQGASRETDQLSQQSYGCR